MFQKQNESLLPGFTAENSIREQRHCYYMVYHTKSKQPELEPQCLRWCPWTTKEECQLDNPYAICMKFGRWCWLPT
jgi:hypothetical protein